MATIKINFDAANNPELPTIVLAHRNGKKIGGIIPTNITVNDSMNAASEVRFEVNKYVDGKKNELWEQIKNFKLIWCKEWDIWFEITVEINEADKTVKTVTGVRLSEAELSQIKLFEYEINTDIDIARDDYKPTVLFNESDTKASLLHRILEKAPHYSVRHVDSTIAKIQRTFQFNDISIYDAFQEISTEIGCLFVFHSDSDKNGKVQREFSVYDLQSNCISCGHRGEFTSICPECGSKEIQEGYGEDTAIFLSSDELANDILFTTDTGSMKNCFKLEGGDDLMTAAVRSCNPNGTDYIWYRTKDMKEDMSEELVSKLEAYDELYNYYQSDYIAELDTSALNKYNDLVRKYRAYNSDLEIISTPIAGFSALMTAYYNTIDFSIYLQSSLMPDVRMSDTNASKQAALLTSANLSPVAVTNLNTISSATADNAVLGMAKAITDSRYQVKVNSSSLSNNIWKGNFVVTNYSDEEDMAISSTVSIVINDNYELYVQQKIEKALSKEEVDNVSIIGLFGIDYSNFCNEIKKYCLDSLNMFEDCCQTAIDILIEQGIADSETWASSDPNLYDDLYLPYYEKLHALQSEIKLRESEIEIISDLQSYIIKTRNKIQQDLDFQTYMGEELWLEFYAYRREDKFSNSNYISDGLNNAELFAKALEFHKLARDEIYKSAELQHSISTSLKNLLSEKKFEPLLKYFAIGNWLRIQIDDKIYKLRLIKFEIDYSNLDKISVDFSDMLIIANGISDIQSILVQAQSMATSYDTVSRQASKGKKSNEQLDDWVNKGLALTKMKIIDSADNQNVTWDSHGLLCREYLPITDNYDDKQLKLINRGLYLTDDNWLTSRAGIGNFTFYNPETEKFEESYGVIADTLVGNLILSEKVGVYNTKNSIVLGENGIVVTTDGTGVDSSQMAFTVRKKMFDSNQNLYYTDLMYVDSYGNLVLNGTIRINTANDTVISTLNELADTNRFSEAINQSVHNEAQNIYGSIDERYTAIISETTEQLERYKADIGQYMQFDGNGLTLGASESLFKTVIDNRGMYFKQGDATVAYINNNQLYIPNAVIQQSLVLGNFFFSPRNDGGVSLVWREHGIQS